MKYTRKIEKIKLKRKRKMLKAKQQLDEASMQCQGLEEETDRGGYISPESSTSSEIASQFSLTKSSLSKGLLQISKLFETLNDENTSQPSQIAESNLGDVDGLRHQRPFILSQSPGEPSPCPIRTRLMLTCQRHLKLITLSRPETFPSKVSHPL